MGCDYDQTHAELSVEPHFSKGEKEQLFGEVLPFGLEKLLTRGSETVIKDPSPQERI
jgi:hypothetical protein